MHTANHRYDLLVAGAGPAGLIAAATAAKAGLRVGLIEANHRPGRKLLVTGGGRCNLTNTLSTDALIQAFGRQSRFVTPAFSALSPQALCHWFDQRGAKTFSPDGFHVFPQSQKAHTILQALTDACDDAHVHLQCNQPVTELLIDPGPNGHAVRGLRCGQQRYTASAVLIATGGLTWPQLGATGIAYRLAEQAGHAIQPPVPALVGLKTEVPWIGQLAGIVLDQAHVRIAGSRGSDAVNTLLLTHHGISGPVVLDLSGDIATLLAKGKPATVRINWANTPATTWYQRFEQWRNHHGRNKLKNLLKTWLPTALIEAIGATALQAHEHTASQLPRSTERQLIEQLTDTRLAITATEGFDKAMVTRGGIRLGAIRPQTLQSKRTAGLYFAGEALDIDGPCGGYNLQWAFASGHLAATAIIANHRQHQP